MSGTGVREANKCPHEAKFFHVELHVCPEVHMVFLSNSGTLNQLQSSMTQFYLFA